MIFGIIYLVYYESILCIVMKPVVTELMNHKHQDQDACGEPYAKPKKINDRINAIAGKNPESVFEEMYDHDLPALMEMVR